MPAPRLCRLLGTYSPDRSHGTATKSRLPSLATKKLLAVPYLGGDGFDESLHLTRTILELQPSAAHPLRSRRSQPLADAVGSLVLNGLVDLPRLDAGEVHPADELDLPVHILLAELVLEIAGALVLSFARVRSVVREANSLQAEAVGACGCRHGCKPARGGVKERTSGYLRLKEWVDNPVAPQAKRLGNPSSQPTPG